MAKKLTKDDEPILLVEGEVLPDGETVTLDMINELTDNRAECG